MALTIRWLWQFGDGESSTEQDPKHYYKMPGTYKWRLDVWDENGNTSSTTGTVIVSVNSNVYVSHTDKSYRVGLKENQGIGPSVNSGDAWPVVASGVPPIEVTDKNGQRKTLVLDNRDGKHYDITPRNGPTASGLIYTRKDKEGINRVITGITLTGTDPVSILAVGHGFVSGNTVEFRGVGGTVELNNKTFVITRTNADNFTLNGTDSSEYTAWTSAGWVFKAGTEVVPKVEFPEDRGEQEHWPISSQESHIYVRPEDEDNRGENGYDASGIPEDTTFALKAYVDGATTDEAEVSDIPDTGDLSFDHKVSGKRIRMVLSADKGGHAVIGRSHDYVVEDIADAPANRTMSWMTYQQELALPAMWAGYRGSTLIDRVTGNAITGVTATQVTGPDSQSSAMQITAAATFPSVSLSAGTLIIWSDGAISATLGGVPVVLVSMGTSGGWTGYKVTALTGSGALVVTPTGTRKIFDVRAYNSAVSAAALAYYYANVTERSGAEVLP